MQLTLTSLTDELQVKSQGPSSFDRYEHIMRDFSMAKSAELIYGRLLQRSVEKHKCQLCKKALASEQEVADFTESVSEHTKQLPRLLEDLSTKLQTAKAVVKGVADSGLNGSQLVLRVSEQEQILAEIQAQVEALKQQEWQVQAQITQVNILIPDCDRLVQLVLKAEQSRVVPATKRMADLRSRLQEAECREQSMNGNRQSLLTEMTSLNTDIARTSAELESLQRARIRSSEFQGTLAELEVSAESLASELTAAEERLLDLRTRLHTANKRRADNSGQARSQLEIAEREALTLGRLEEAVSEIDRAILSFETKMSEISHIYEALQHAERNENHLAQSAEDTRTQLSDVESRYEELDRIRALLTRNVQFKRMQAEISILEAELASVGEAEDYSAQISQLRQQMMAQRDSKARTEGEFNQISEQMRGFDTKLSSATFRDIDTRVSQAWIAHETTATAVKDLQRYYTALDRALMKYHQHKMQEINAAIASLWQTVYKGNDIDCIAIRSDVEDEAEGTGKRSYNYRVVMLTNDVELEMRGRCSAGQKVLASIIIRLALADSFCHNCGILALDEPTTNLDKANIEGLAEALCKLIEARRKTNNFQLIIISHDEEFVRSLSKLQVCDSSFRITKDARGCSRIKRELIYELQ